MAQNIKFTKTAQQEYQAWKLENPAKAERIDRLLKAIQDDPFNGIGKPEPLKYELSGWWSRRIDDGNRLIYKVAKDTIIVLQVKFHYRK